MKVAEITLDYYIPTNPSFAISITELGLGANVVMLHGVKLDIITAAFVLMMIIGSFFGI